MGGALVDRLRTRQSDFTPDPIERIVVDSADNSEANDWRRDGFINVDAALDALHPTRGSAT